MMVLWILLATVVVMFGYIRLAPSDPASWNTMPSVTQNENLPGGTKRLIPAGPDGLARFDAIARATPRTTVLAGSPDEGMVTYVTRSKIIGFPDYTTVQQDGDTLKIYARLRFGQSDFGVNRDRVDAWISELQAR